MNGLLHRGAPNYPSRLAKTPDAPELLHWRGSLLGDEGPWVAIVGARAASGADVELAAAMAREVVAANGVVVSGGALGIDAAAHRGALEAGGKTVAVLAAGFKHLYPAVHRSLFANIESEGTLLTPYRPDVPPRRYHFVRRNRIIAGLCDLVVVVSADRASGSLYTAKAARDYDRRLAAAPGSPGCEALLADAAALVEDATGLGSLVRGHHKPTPPANPVDSLEAAVLAELGAEPIDASTLADRLGSNAREIDRALTGLELARLALAVPGRAYICSALGQAARS